MGPPLDESPGHRRTLREHLWVRYTSEGVLTPSPTTRTLSTFCGQDVGLEPTTLHFSAQSPTANVAVLNSTANLVNSD